MVISVHGLAKSFRVGVRSKKIWAVQDATFDVAANEVFGFVGPNGAGKSTTIHMLLGLVRPSRGTGHMLGQALGSLSARRRVGYMPELPNLYPHLRAAELLELSGKLLGLDRRQLQREIPARLEQVGLHGVERNLLRTFSKGMLQRVALAQTLLGDPELVVLDEPMSGLDPLGRHIVRNVIADLKQRRKTVFFSSHILPDIEALCDRVAVIAAGRVLRVASVDSLLAEAGSRYEIVLRGVNVDLAQDLAIQTQVMRVGEHLRLVVENEDQLQHVLDWGRQHGSVVGVAPVRGNLEEIVIDEVKRAEASA